MKKSLLVVEPDPQRREEFSRAFADSEFLPRFEPTAEKAIEWALSGAAVEAVILTTRLAGLQGSDACRVLKQDARTARTPVLFVVDGAKPEVIACLRAGADDVLSWPFHAVELLWRVRGAARRAGTHRPIESSVLRLGALRLDAEQGLCRLGARALSLSPREFALLEAFLRRPGRVLKRAYLVESVWGLDAPVGRRAVDLAVCRLRAKLGRSTLRLETVAGFGYRLSAAGKLKPQ